MEEDSRIEELKDEIRDIDVKIVLLFNERADFSTELNNLKKELNMVVYDRLEDMEIMESLEDISNYNNMIDTIYPSILKYCRSLYD